VDIRHFGAGNRRPQGPPLTDNVESQVIHSDARGLIAELAFRRRGRIALHDNPNTTWFCVIEGGGYVQVGEEQRRVGPGEAVLWPPNVGHAAWTVGTQMRAIVVEFAGADDSQIRGLIEGSARRLRPGERGHVAKGEGKLVSVGGSRRRAADAEGEPD
jgi:quercetin dioxygenase-like cupin family protein